MLADEHIMVSVVRQVRHGADFRGALRPGLHAERPAPAAMDRGVGLYIHRSLVAARTSPASAQMLVGKQREGIMTEAPWRQRFQIRWPSLEPDPQPAPRWTWQFDADQTGELGRWVVTPRGGGAPRLADPHLPPAYAVGCAIHTTFAVIGLATAQGYTVYHVEPGAPARQVYQHSRRIAVGPLSRDGALVCIQHTENSDWYHPALRVLDMQGRPISDLSDAPAAGLWPGPWSPLADDHRLIVHHQRADRFRPALWTPHTGALHEIALPLPGDVWATWYPDTHALLLNQELRGRNSLFRYDLHQHSVTPILTEPGTIWETRIRPDGAIDYLGDHSARPPTLRSTVHGQLSLDPVPLLTGRAYQDLDVAGVHGFLVEPATPRPHPTIVMARCNNVDHNHDAFSPVVQSWVDHDFAVVLPNYRGTLGYGRAWRDAALGHPGFTELADIATAADGMVAQGIADPARMILFGESWGGYLTLLGLGTQAARWALGIAMVPVGDFVACYEDAMPPLQAMNQALFGGAPADVPEVYAAASPITYVERVRAPVMLVVSDHDARCSRRQNERYIARLRACGKPHTVMRLAGGHGVWGAAMLPHVEAQLAFAARYLGTRPPD
jgi:dipeptidyl aminopeptidase/acylaminoacyl peptidase